MNERFDAYMERCLYDPVDGFYSGGGVAGRRGGDFITSPEVGPLFAEVLARAIDRWWVELGQPDVLPVYDVGTGPGTLVQGLERAAGPSQLARRVVGVDRADGGELPADLSGSIVIANELLDNLPFRVVERTVAGWSEIYVDGGTEHLVPLAEPPPIADIDVLPAGIRVPWLEQAHRWVADVVARQPFALLVFDYGAPTTAALAERGGWLRTYRQHERADDPYRDPGRWDITTDVAIDQLPTPTEVVDQANFLRRHGIEELVAEGRRYWDEHAAVADLAALRMRSRISEAEALLDPAGLGSWLTCLWLTSRTGGPAAR